MGKIYQIDILKSIKIFEKNLTIFGILIEEPASNVLLDNTANVKFIVSAVG